MGKNKDFLTVYFMIAPNCRNFRREITVSSGLGLRFMVNVKLGLGLELG